MSCAEKAVKIKPEISGITESIYASGTVKSLHQYQAYATVNGIVKEVFVDEGDTIKKGAPILSVSDEVQQLNKQNASLAVRYTDVGVNAGKLNDAKMAISLALNKMKNDSLLYRRTLSLWEQNIGSRIEMEQRQLNYQNARNLYHAATVNYEDLKRQLSFNAAQSINNLAISDKVTQDYTVRSEIDGMVYELPRKKGEIIGLQTPLALIGDANNFTLELQVDEYDIVQIEKGMPIAVTMDSYKDQVFEAIVTKINPTMNERTRTFVVEAAFTKRPAHLYPNTTFEASIICRSKSKTLLIPRNFMLNDSTVVKSNGEKVIVKTGLKDYRKIEILSGIDANDELKQPTP